MPITAAHLKQATPQSPEDKFRLSANAVLDKHLEAIFYAVKTELADKNFEKIKQIVMHGNTVLHDGDRRRRIEAAADQRAQLEIPGAQAILDKIMGEFAKSGLAHSAQNPSGMVPNELRKSLENQIEKDIRTAVGNAFKNTYQSLAEVEKHDNATRQAQREDERQVVENKVHSLRTFAKVLAIGGPLVAAVTACVVTGNVWCLVFWGPVCAAAGTAGYFILPKMVEGTARSLLGRNP